MMGRTTPTPGLVTVHTSGHLFKLYPGARTSEGGLGVKVDLGDVFAGPLFLSAQKKKIVSLLLASPVAQPGLSGLWGSEPAARVLAVSPET